ncbi:MAG: hypothetical protein ABL886_04735, partial [Rhodoglobus sp.]
MASIVLSGRVLLKETQRGVEGLVVVATAPDPVGRLGSTTTDSAGGFALEVTLPTGAERAALTLTVVPPDGAAQTKPLLVTSPRVVGAGPESFVLWISDAALVATEIERPAPGPDAAPDPGLVRARAAAEVGQRRELATALAGVYAPGVAAQREKSRVTYDSVEQRLRADFGMNRGGRERVAHAGIDIGPAVGTAVRDAIFNVAANGPSFLRLTIWPHELDALRSPSGGATLDRVKVEALAFAGGARARTREDAIARWCAKLRRPLPSGEQPLPSPVEPAPPPSSSDLDAALTQIVDEIARRTAPVISARGDESSLKGRLRALDLAGGPADRAAFFDYGTLVGTIDGVWQELLDRDLVGNAADLLEALGDVG